MEILFEILLGSVLGWMIGMSTRVAHEKTFSKDILISVLGGLSCALFLQMRGSALVFSTAFIAGTFGSLFFLAIASILRKTFSESTRKYSHS